MRRRWSLGLVVALLAGIGLAGCGDDSSADELTVAVENAYLPFNYLDPETGEPTGWDYDVLEEICERVGCTPVFENFPWEPMIQAVADGQFDMAADGITITAERAEIVDFSDGYINVDQRLMVRKGENRFSDGASFAAGDYVLGTQIGTTNYDTGVELVGEDRVEPYEEFGFVVQSLIAGDVDAVIIDETAGQGYIGENADEVELIGGSLSSDQLGFIFPKGSKWVEPINEALAEMKADGTLAQISSRYFGEGFTITYDDLEFPEYEE
ncbi:MAG: transporter substrate-binding domain-containing protein [Acidimicrobiaceae bacterium]|nr:transporter substrate-binding domain-containing protein [Acidimicrobiaceae bacterium]